MNMYVLWKQIAAAVLCGTWIFLSGFAQSAGTPFLTCVNGTQKCASLGCTECKCSCIAS